MFIEAVIRLATITNIGLQMLFEARWTKRDRSNNKNNEINPAWSMPGTFICSLPIPPKHQTKHMYKILPSLLFFFFFFTSNINVTAYPASIRVTHLRICWLLIINSHGVELSYAKPYRINTRVLFCGLASLCYWISNASKII